MSILSVKGPQDGEITLHTSPETVMGSFEVSVNAASPDGSLFVLYRLRVKEASILFSKKYSVLGGAHTVDQITMYAQPSLLTSEKISTIRVEYTVLTPEDAARLLKPEVQLDRATCQPFFSHTGSLTYDVKCVISTSPAPAPAPAPASPPAPAPTHPTPPPRSTLWVVCTVVCVASAAAVGFRLYRSFHTTNA